MKFKLLSIALLVGSLSSIAILLLSSQPVYAQAKSSVVGQLLTQTEPTKITSVKIAPVGQGIEIALENAAGVTLSSSTTRTQGNVSYTDIPKE